MIRVSGFLMVCLLSFVNLVKAPVTFCREYVQFEAVADSDFTQPRDICVDPGHGGPSARKYGNNGDGAGSYGYEDSLSEQWINLQVAYALRDSLYPPVMGVLLTRQDSSDIDPPPYGLWWRVGVANYANMGTPVHEFISIHHNGFPNPADQGTESFWTNSATTDSNATRDTTSKLSRKVRMKIRYAFNADAECYECYKDRGTRVQSFFVLRNSRPASALPEASDITWHPEEEAAYDDPLGWHAQVEAGGIIRGWCSYKNNSGFVAIRNSAVTGGDGYLWTEEYYTGTRTEWASPYRTCWEEGEYWYIDFPMYQVIGDYDHVVFHHLEELEHGYYSTTNRLPYVVPQCSTHTIVAYYTGGPYSAQLLYPDGGQHLRTCTDYPIRWDASVGADSTTHIDLHISRDGGSSFEPVSQGLANTGSYMWRVSGLASEQCRMKVVAHDTAGNQTFDVSDENFAIQAHTVNVTYPDIPLIWWEGEERTITWGTAYLCTTSYADIYISRDGGGNFDPIASGLENTGSCTWTVTGPYSTHCRIKVVVDDVVGNSAEDISNNDFIISDSGNNNPVLDSHLQCKYPQDECADCVKFTESVTVEISASDPDGDSIFYEWWVWSGHFAENGQHSITTADNYVTYVAPAKAKEGAVVQFQDCISVCVTDVRGGQTCAVGEPELFDGGYSCGCGDVNDDGVVNVGDVVYLVTYLYKGGPGPVEPTVRGDSNNDCSVNVGDIVYLVTYLYHNGPFPRCCWFVPGDKLKPEGYSFR
jgi:N-acetylmuramoyl-L-alanine amidase